MLTSQFQSKALLFSTLITNFTSKKLTHQSKSILKGKCIRLSPLQATFNRTYVTSTSIIMSDKITKTEEEWRAALSKEQFRVLREKGTEPSGTGEYDKFYDKGIYACAGCQAPLYKSDFKFNSGCGWPAFFDALPGAINKHEDKSFGMNRIEITCAKCGGHLGHLFKNEGFKTPTNERHCVNSVSLKFHEEP